jgi:quercetin dioxygenase-like cupin family protein
MDPDYSKLALKPEDWPHIELVPKSMLKAGNVTAQVAHGKDCSIILATRSPGYHSKPHRHNAEQINYVLSGKAWLFVEDQGFYGGEGSVSRIPAGAIHWSWVLGDEPITVIEIHTPPLTGDAPVYAGKISMCLTPEEEAMVKHIPSEWPDDFDPSEIEKRWVGRAYVAE